MWNIGNKNYNITNEDLELAFLDASEERISTVTDRAYADWIMIDHSTIRIHAARARTRIFAPLIDARSIRAAVGADYAFRSARRWATDIIRLAGAYRVIINDATVAVRSTGGWLACVTRHRRFCEKIYVYTLQVFEYILLFIMSHRRCEKSVPIGM